MSDLKLRDLRVCSDYKGLGNLQNLTPFQELQCVDDYVAFVLDLVVRTTFIYFKIRTWPREERGFY